METLDLTKYKTEDLKRVADLDPFSVRDEAYARSEKAAKKIAKLIAQIDKFKQELAECGKALEAASAELNKEAE